jgi:hypothetical protein
MYESWSIRLMKALPRRGSDLPIVANVGHELDLLQRHLAKLKSAIELSEIVKKQGDEDLDAHRKAMREGDFPEDPTVPMTRQQKFSDWRIFAAHGAVIAIFDCREHLNSLEERFRDWGMDPAMATEALADFDKCFPHWKAARNAVAHSADIAREPETHYHTGKLSSPFIEKTAGNSLLVSNGFFNDTFVTTRRGVLLELELTESTTGKVARVISGLGEACIMALSINE